MIQGSGHYTPFLDAYSCEFLVLIELDNRLVTYRLQTPFGSGSHRTLALAHVLQAFGIREPGMSSILEWAIGPGPTAVRGNMNTGAILC